MKGRPMIDVQKQPGIRVIDIDKVGVSDICYPIIVLDKKNLKQSTVARIDISVDLPSDLRGTHMSRFIEILNHHRGEITVHKIGGILREVADNLEAKCSHINVAFKYFIEKEAPVSRAKSLMDYDCRFIASYHREHGEDFILEITAPVMSLCPCSKEMSGSAAHNQRSEVTVQIRFDEFVWMEEIIDIIEESASSEVFALLKREDEKAVAERAYDHPRFVEDIVRIIAARLLDDRRISWFTIKSKNYESIHNHNAYAFIERDKKNLSHDR